MYLLHLMNDVPLWATALGVTAMALTYSIGLMLLVRGFLGVDRLKLNNEVAGFKFAVVGVFYGVLLAFVVVSVWEDFHTTEAAVRDEAKAAVDLHRLTYALPIEGGASPAPSQLHRPRAQIRMAVDGPRPSERRRFRRPRRA